MLLRPAVAVGQVALALGDPRVVEDHAPDAIEDRDDRVVLVDDPLIDHAVLERDGVAPRGEWAERQHQGDGRREPGERPSRRGHAWKFSCGPADLAIGIPRNGHIRRHDSHCDAPPPQVKRHWCGLRVIQKSIPPGKIGSNFGPFPVPLALPVPGSSRQWQSQWHPKSGRSRTFESPWVRPPPARGGGRSERAVGLGGRAKGCGTLQKGGTGAMSTAGTPIKFRCSNCGKNLGVSRSKAGMLVACPRCETEQVVPEPPPEAVAVAEAADADPAALFRNLVETKPAPASAPMPAPSPAVATEPEPAPFLGLNLGAPPRRPPPRPRRRSARKSRRGRRRPSRPPRPRRRPDSRSFRPKPPPPRPSRPSAPRPRPSRPSLHPERDGTLGAEAQ